MVTLGSFTHPHAHDKHSDDDEGPAGESQDAGAGRQVHRQQASWKSVSGELAVFMEFAKNSAHWQAFMLESMKELGLHLSQHLRWRATGCPRPMALALPQA